MAGLRFLISIFVMLFHMVVVAPWEMELISPIFSKGWIGTDFFLILSGFVIVLGFKSKLETGSLRASDFIWGRILRIWPPHALVLILFLGYFGLFTSVGYTTGDPDFFSASIFVAQFFLINTLVFTEQGWNVPTWTLSALLICYVFYAFSVSIFSTIKRPAYIICLVLLIVILSELASYAVFGKSFTGLSEQLAVFRAVPLFVVGVFLGQLNLATSTQISNINGRHASLLLPAILIIGHFYSGPESDVIIIFLICIVIFFVGADRKASLTVHALGRLSFAIYLIHVPMIYVYFPVLQRILKIERSDLCYTVSWIIFPVIVVAIAFFFERFIEAPLAKFARQRMDARWVR